MSRDFKVVIAATFAGGISEGGSKVKALWKFWQTTKTKFLYFSSVFSGHRGQRPICNLYLLDISSCTISYSIGTLPSRTFAKMRTLCNASAEL